jgi:hypothetical protein
VSKRQRTKESIEKSKRQNSLARAGEYRVLSELLLRGLEPFTVSDDKGIDILLANGLKVDVKIISAYTIHHQNIKQGTVSYRYERKEYLFNAHRSQRDKELDFYIIWLLELDEFYIIPAKVVGKSKQQKIYPTTPNHRYSQYKGAWELLSTALKGGETKN